MKVGSFVSLFRVVMRLDQNFILSSDARQHIADVTPTS